MASRILIRDDRDLEREVEEGDLIEYDRGYYQHWAVYIGKGRVVHLTGIGEGRMQSNPQHSFSISGATFNKACVKEDDFWAVAGESKAYKNNDVDRALKPKPKKDIVKDATSRIGQVGYNLIMENCEHFAKFCRYGVERSDQVRAFAMNAGIGVAIGLGMTWLLGDDKK